MFLKKSIIAVMCVGMLICACSEGPKLPRSESSGQCFNHIRLWGSPVKNSSSAIKMAKNYLLIEYGQKALQDAEPLQAERLSDLWVVRGHVPEGHVGGSYIVKIKVEDGCIIAAYPER